MHSSSGNLSSLKYNGLQHELVKTLIEEEPIAKLKISRKIKVKLGKVKPLKLSSADIDEFYD